VAVKLKRLIACYSIYNEEIFLKQSLDTVDGKVDVVLIIDGAYKGYDSPHSASYDKTLEIIKDYSFKSELVFIPAPEQPWKTQMVKRSQYFKFGGQGDWYVIIDADETVVHGLDELKKFLRGMVPPFVNGFWIKMVTRVTSEEPYWGMTPRIYRHQDGLYYDYNHSYVLTKDNKQIKNIGDYPLLVLEHHGHLRPKRRTMTADHRRRGRGEVVVP